MTATCHVSRISREEASNGTQKQHGSINGSISKPLQFGKLKNMITSRGCIPISQPTRQDQPKMQRASCFVLCVAASLTRSSGIVSKAKDIQHEENQLPMNNLHLPLKLFASFFFLAHTISPSQSLYAPSRKVEVQSLPPAVRGRKCCKSCRKRSGRSYSWLQKGSKMLFNVFFTFKLVDL